MLPVHAIKFRLSKIFLLTENLQKLLQNVHLLQIWLLLWLTRNFFTRAICIPQLQTTTLKSKLCTL